MLKKNLPNLITLLNLLMGCLAVVFVFKGELHIASYLIGLATVFDFLDGFFARIFKAYSEFGKQLDSLADMISFGFAPSVIMYVLIKDAVPETFVGVDVLPFFAFSVALFSALRLAKFNIDERQSDSFIGIPTPANAILIASFPLIMWHYPSANDGLGYIMSGVLKNSYFLLIFTAMSAISLISGLKLFSLKFRHFSWKGNSLRYIFLGVSLLMLALFNCAGIPMVIFFYILLSVFVNYFNNSKDKSTSL